MGLSSKDRKLLWGPARNICAFPLSSGQASRRASDRGQTCEG